MVAVFLYRQIPSYDYSLFSSSTSHTGTVIGEKGKLTPTKVWTIFQATLSSLAIKVLQ